MKYSLFGLLLSAPVLWACNLDDQGICWDDVPSNSPGPRALIALPVAPIVPYVYVAPAAPRVLPQFPLRARHSAPIIAVGVTPDSGPVAVYSYPQHGTTHIVQKGKITTCFTIGANTVVCQ